MVVTTGDVFLDFNPEDIQFYEQGITGLGCQASPDLASDHGVYCSGPDGKVVERMLFYVSPFEILPGQSAPCREPRD